MERKLEITVNTELLEDLIEHECPNGVAKLSVKADVHHSTITKMRAGDAPKKRSTRKKIAEKWDVSIDELFLPLPAASKAS